MNGEITLLFDEIRMFSIKGLQILDGEMEIGPNAMIPTFHLKVNRSISLDKMV